MTKDTKITGSFVIQNQTDGSGHEETYVYHRGTLIHKRWRPTDGASSYSKTFGKYGGDSVSTCRRRSE